ncbi:hypothetical protein ACIO53_05570 [Streptomyces sp. NPDC087305]|uniref:hypothetical protein n=1 Tax=Streptomyces sp. NPDC087305 TaxID=3365781 RepID=UPI0038125B68
MSELAGTARQRARRVLRETGRWVLRRRRTAAEQFLRGASYGAGTAVMSLLVLWVRTRH